MSILGLTSQVAECGTCEASVGPITVVDRLNQRKQRLERELADLNAAIDALNANPEVTKILALVSKVASY